jgi:hypothetical protein
MPPEEFDLGSALDSIAAELPPVTNEPEAAPSPPAPAAAPAPSPEAAPAPRAYPKSWKPDHSTEWEKLPDWAKDEIYRREDDFHKGLEPYKSKAQLGERWERLLKPHESVLQQYNIDPEQMLGNLIQAQLKLSLGKPEDRVSMLKQIINDFKIDPTQLGFGPPAEAPYIDPNLQALQSELSDVKSRLTAEDQRRAVEVKQKVEAEIQAFRSDPKHDLFDQAANEIAQILKADPKSTLAEAYERATWMNSATRAILLERQAKEAAAAREKEERERAEKAAAANRGSVRTTPRSSSATAPVGTMEETMRETLKALNARAN